MFDNGTHRGTITKYFFSILGGKSSSIKRRKRLLPVTTNIIWQGKGQDRGSLLPLRLDPGNDFLHQGKFIFGTDTDQGNSLVNTVAGLKIH